MTDSAVSESGTFLTENKNLRVCTSQSTFSRQKLKNGAHPKTTSQNPYKPAKTTERYNSIIQDEIVSQRDYLVHLRNRTKIDHPTVKEPSPPPKVLDAKTLLKLEKI